MPDFAGTTNYYREKSEAGSNYPRLDGMNLRDKVLSILERVSEDKVKRGYTFHKGVLMLLGYDWWSSSYREMPVWYVPAHLLYFAYQLFNQMGLFIFGMYYVYKMEVKSDEDLTDLVKNVILCMALLASSAKAVFIFYKRHTIKQLIDYMEGLGELHSTTPYLERALTASVGYLGVVYLNALTWSIYSGIFKGGELPILAIYPWDTDNSFAGYIAGYGVQVMASVFCALSHGSLDTLMPVSMGVVCQHVKELRLLISRLGTESHRIDAKIISSFVELHNKVLRGVELMNETAGFLFMAQVFYIITHACIIIFLVVRVSDFASIVVNVIPMLTAAYTQLLLYCYFGQMLTSQMDDLREDVRNNEWYSCSERTKRSLIIIGEVCKRSIGLEGGGGVFAASHHTYLQSLQESVSYFLFLKTMTGQDD